jgi:hypothetical protein
LPCDTLNGQTQPQVSMMLTHDACLSNQWKFEVSACLFYCLPMTSSLDPNPVSIYHTALPAATGAHADHLWHRTSHFRTTLCHDWQPTAFFNKFWYCIMPPIEILTFDLATNLCSLGHKISCKCHSAQFCHLGLNIESVHCNQSTTTSLMITIKCSPIISKKSQAFATILNESGVHDGTFSVVSLLPYQFWLLCIPSFGNQAKHNCRFLSQQNTTINLSTSW